MLMPHDTARPTTSAALPWPTQDRSWRLVLRRTRDLMLQVVPYLVALVGVSLVLASLVDDLEGVLEAAPAPDPAASVPFPIPALVYAFKVDDAPETITILGEGFVPGGQVEVLLYDHAGEVIDAQWTTATTTNSIATTTNDLDYSGSGSIRPGTVSVVLRTPCGPSLRLRAWDYLSARWSDWLTYDPTC